MQNYNLRCRFNHGTRKMHQDDTDGGFAAYQVNLAQNGTDSFHITIWTNDPADGLQFFVDPPVSTDGHALSAEAFLLAYLPVRGRPTPDPMMPNTGTFSAARNNSPSFAIRVKAPKGAPAGLYQGACRVEKDGIVLNRLEFSAKVWGFALPDVPSCGTLFGLNKGSIRKWHNATSEETDVLYQKYYDFLLEHKINAYALPFDILDDRADAYLSDPRVQSFVIPFPPEDDLLRATHQKLSARPEWFRKGVFYPIDEPQSPESFDRYRAICARLEKLYPNYQLITPLGESWAREGGDDSISQLAPYQTRWCLRSDMFGSNGTAGYTDADGINMIAKQYGNVMARMEQEKAGGDDIWWYVCGFPYMMTYCDLNLDGSGASHRVLFWQQFAYNVEGLLYWSANHWNTDGSPWVDPFTYDKIRYGDGSILYNGNEIGVDGPVGSLRLEMVRAGIDDFEMLAMARNLLPQEALEAITNPLVNPAPALNKALYGTKTPDMFTFCDNDDTFYGARAALGNAIEAAMRG